MVTSAIFNNYEDCKKSLNILRKNYPEAKINMSKVVTTCYEEFIDKTGGKIIEYEK